jgi:siroheme synthase-like protein
MRYYPIFLDLRGRDVLVVGAGPVSLRKCVALVEAGAKVTVVSPQAVPEFKGLGVTMIHREFRCYDVQSQALVFAATDRRDVNAEVARCAAEKGIPVNVADAPQECSFLVPARVERGSLQVAISTSGEDPRLAKRLRIQLEALLDQAEQELARKKEPE